MSCCCRDEQEITPLDTNSDTKEISAEEQILRETNSFQENIRFPTDILFLVLFICFIVILCVLSTYAFVFGHPERLIHSVDSLGRICGVSEGVQNKPNLFFFDILSCANILRVIQNGNIDLGALFTCPTQQVYILFSFFIFPNLLRSNGDNKFHLVYE